MRTLFVFIYKNNFFFLFLLLQVFCFYLLVQNNKYHRANYINSANNVSGSIYETRSNISEYFKLKETNEQLMKENSQLRSLLPSALRKISQHTFAIEDTIFNQQFKFIAAKVVNNSINRKTNYLTLNKGSAHGIKPDMGVITSMGVVGIVTQVSENFSTVMSLLHKNSKVSAKLNKDGTFGSLIWEDGDSYREATLKDIPTHVALANGDLISTSAFSLTFPENIPIGEVQSFEKKSGDYFYTVKVNLSTHFKKVHHVYVINSLLKQEQKQLEESIKDDQ